MYAKISVYPWVILGVSLGYLWVRIGNGSVEGRWRAVEDRERVRGGWD